MIVIVIRCYGDWVEVMLYFCGVDEFDKCSVVVGDGVYVCIWGRLVVFL